jgi:hypothetical protein
MLHGSGMLACLVDQQLSTTSVAAISRCLFFGTVPIGNMKVTLY